ncbi:AAA family ATPase [Planctomycetes bacterium TBK1r]|uniref:ATPase AAA-type core domain-containing protein n=1 Tax=Stieleria magnilauensis TaxID=2527963 RepID=A0ABX5Y071_9BACT|nr:hypothetical protein TBK1r_62110 [Planctomycetes bacterium TBK1r]
MNKIEEILIPEQVANDYASGDPLGAIGKIRRLNVFVGPNNSGKSRFLRELFVQGKNLRISTGNSLETEARELSREALNFLNAVDADKHIHKALHEEARQVLSSTACVFDPCASYPAPIDRNPAGLTQIASKIHDTFRSLAPGSPWIEAAEKFRDIFQCIKKLSRERKKEVSEEDDKTNPFAEAISVYVPTLRGMRMPFDSDNAKYRYFDRTWSDYFQERSQDLGLSKSKDFDAARKSHCGTRITTGLDFYGFLTDHLLGSLAERQFVSEYEQYLSQVFFEGEPVALIPRREHDTVNIRIGTEAERPIQNLGDGLQQLIIITLPLFQHKDKPLLLFVEEPDLFLHPGFQKVFIDSVLQDKERELYVFVATHSPQFLDITLSEVDCSVFRFSKDHAEGNHPERDPHFTIQCASQGDRELLTYLGVKPSSYMFSNCTIWVEGITDRLYFSRFIEIVLNSTGDTYIENLHYSFVEYGGGNITHWSFLDEDGIDVERLCSKLLLISDEDNARAGSAKARRQEALRDALGERFLPLTVREVENLLSPDVLRRVIYDYEGGEVELNDFKQADYSKKYLGSFIDEKVLVDRTKSSRCRERGTAYAGSSGTIKSKVEFCKKALRHLKSMDDLSDDAKKITERIIGFIRDENA